MMFSFDLYELLLGACYEGSKIHLVQKTIHKIDINKAIYNEGTALIISCLRGNLKMVEYLLSVESIDVNKKGLFGYTPLIWSCHHNNIDIIRLLLSNDKI